ncbi:YidH family protein [Tuberibacillus sp. Marseille-P3662]|uniref:YidH family protein n=1 Tax=Tuberibacillus sp. Marseille-P3662 TaxID=1965358 RepID=UPI000A1CA0A2|nr:DUF202 domain-containing protein [Tuberibacillus sp. Marseille-P3662]
MEKIKEDNNQLPYAQQHLANERTYLAWIRTAIAIIGIGLLTLHYFFDNLNDPFANVLTMFIGISIGLFGICMIMIATSSYIKKKKQIESQSFYSSQIPIYLVSLMMVIIGIFTIVYFTFLTL